MGTRVPVQHYNLRSASSFIGSSLHDLNTIDSRPTDMEGISDVDRDAVDGDSLDNDEDSSAVVSMLSASLSFFVFFFFLCDLLLNSASVVSMSFCMPVIFFFGGC